MKKLYFILMVALPLSVFCQSAGFIKTFGGKESELVYSVQQTTDGGYILSGQTDSFGGAISGKSDVWIIKLNPKGEIEWDKTYGGENRDVGFCIQQIAGEGYILAGLTESLGKKFPSIWILKLNNRGDTLWTRFYEGKMVSHARSIKQTSDGGYIIAGKGDENILKLDKDGKKEWGRRIGWIHNSVDQTSDGGYILAGDTIYKPGEWDYIPSLTIVKTDKDGKIEWKNPFGEVFPGSASSVSQTKDGGYIMAGDSMDLKTGYDHSHFLMVSKLDKHGRREWTYYGSEFSAAQSVRQTSDEGFIVSGNSLDAEHGTDVLLVRLDKTGKEVWRKVFGESDGWEYASDALQTSDNGYMVAAQADSYGAGRYDWWVLKLDENGNGPDPTGISESSRTDFILYGNYPNPFSHTTTITFYLPQPGWVNLKIYNSFGQEIVTIADRFFPPGEFREVWNPEGMAGGIFLYRLQYNERVKTGKLILLDQ
jgi:hypothetical protein